MTNLRSLIAASALAIAAATGSAVAAPSLNTNIAIENTGASVEQASHFGGYGNNYLCYYSFHQLAMWYGFHQARMIKWRCRMSFFGYGYNGYGYGR